MKHGSLFSGIGGFDLAAQWMGWENVFHCEWNPFCQKILKHHFPHSIPYDDITKTDFTIHRGGTDILTGGFPCQPYSSAGKRLGTADDRHLWPEMLRAIREIQPRYVVGENVRGLTNWNGGLVFDQVQSDLEAEGFEVMPFLLPACAVGAPHRRDRIWFIAHSEGNNGKYGIGNEKYKSHSLQEKRFNESIDASDSHNERLEGYASQRIQTATRGGNGIQNAITLRMGYKHNWKNFPTQSPVCSRNDGLSGGLDGITFSKWREESLKAYGNAIVPQVALQIFKAIEQTKS